MEIILPLLQILVGLLILNVWTLRREKPTPWRGGDADSMRHKFRNYGLPLWFMEVIKWAKISLALLLMARVWIPDITKPTANSMALLMAGAIAMHLKIRDPLPKSYPASAVLVACVAVAFSQVNQSLFRLQTDLLTLLFSHQSIH